MSDNIAFENTRMGETPLDWQSVSQKQIIVPIADSNATNYNGNIRYNITSLQGSFVNWNEAILQIPVKVVHTITAAGSQTVVVANQWALGIRNGTINLIDNFELKLNGVQLVTPQQYTNIFAGFRMLTSWSQDTLRKVGPSVAFWPDSAGSCRWIVAGTSNANGDNISNNVNYSLTAPLVATAAGQTVAPEVWNEGFYRRQQYLFGYNSVGYGGFLGTGAGVPGIPTSKLVQPAKSYWTVGTGGATTVGLVSTLGTWNIMCQIRLCDLHDVFKRLPFSEYGQVEMTFYYNQFNPTVTTTAGSMVLAGVGQQFGNTNPFMLPSATALNGGALTCVAGNAGTLTQTMTIGNDISSGTQLFIPTYKLDPEYRANLVATRPFSLCRYEKMLQNQTSCVAGTGFNFNVTPGQANLKYIVVAPYYSTSGNGQTAGAGAVAQYQNPFDSAGGGGTTCPLASIVQFNVLVNNSPVLPSNCNYEFDMFLNQVQRINALNASDVDSLNSGLISEFMWTNAYRYLVVDLSRQELENASSPKSVSIIGTNNTNVKLDLFTFLVYENEIKIYTETGVIEA
jgi:hypothetical protein